MMHEVTAATGLDYLDNMYCYEARAVVAFIDGARLCLDRTVFYPQGGGQQCDTGTIVGDGFAFAVSKVTFSDGIVMHEGVMLRGKPAIGDVVDLHVDIARRRTNSALQSAGHLLLNAMRDAGQRFVATKGYHFPDGPYVEFAGSVAEADREPLRLRLQQEIDRLVAADVSVSATLVAGSDLSHYCANVPANVPKDRPARIVTIDGLSQPCGGTHVRSTGELRGMRVEKIKGRKGDTRVSYSIALRSE